MLRIVLMQWIAHMDRFMQTLSAEKMPSWYRHEKGHSRFRIPVRIWPGIFAVVAYFTFPVA